MLSKYKAVVTQLKNTYSSLDPFYLADTLNIEVLYVNFGENPKGMYTNIKGRPTILLNDSLKDLPERMFVMAHELYHYLDHADNAAYYIQNDKARSKLETEANKFAIALLLELYIEDNDKLPETVKEVSAHYGVSFMHKVEKLF